MSCTPTKVKSLANAGSYKTPNKNESLKTGRPKMQNIKAANKKKHKPNVVLVNSDSDLVEDVQVRTTRKSLRRPSPTKRYTAYCVNVEKVLKIEQKKSERRVEVAPEELTDEEISIEVARVVDQSAVLEKPSTRDVQLLQPECNVAGISMFGFNTPKKRDGMALAAVNATPHTPKTPLANSNTKTPDSKRKKLTAEPKTPAHVRHRVKNQIAKIVADSGSDFSAEDSDYQPSGNDSLSSSDDNGFACENSEDDAADDEPKTPCKVRRAIVVPLLPKTPSSARQRQSGRIKKSADYVPESDGYFQSHASAKILTSDHTLERLKNPRLPADRLFSLLAEMRPSLEHEIAINAVMDEYRTYFPRWMYILNEGFNILIYGLGSKRQLLQSFHRDVLARQTVLVINGFFPSLTLKDILDSIVGEILDAGVSPANPHEAVDLIEEEFALIPETHLYLIVHNLDGAMLRNAKSQAVLARLARIANIHLVASIDHINTPLLWDQNKLSNYNFSWWDCTTMLPYVDETAFENSLLVQNSGELALSSMRSVFSSLTTNSRGIYMLIVKFQLKHKSNPNYQGMPFKDLYWSCRESFLVSSDLALRAQLTEFLDHKLVRSKRSVDGSEQLTIPIDSGLLQQFLEEQEKK